MDHAGDVARRLQEGIARHPYGRRRHDVPYQIVGDRQKTTFVYATGDGGVFRVTVEDLDAWENATPAELHEHGRVDLEALLPEDERWRNLSPRIPSDEVAPAKSLDEWIAEGPQDEWTAEGPQS